MPARKLTWEQRREIKRALEAGEKPKALAYRMNVNPNTIIYWGKQYGVWKSGSNLLTPQDEARAMHLYATDKRHVKEIAAEFGLLPNTLSKMAERHKVKRPPREPRNTEYRHVSTPEIDQYIAENYARCTSIQIGAQIDKTDSWVRHRARELGLCYRRNHEPAPVFVANQQGME